MSAKKERTYVPVPKVPAKVQARYDAVMRVLAGASTVTAAARELEMSRNHFQSLLHRAMEAVIEEITPKRGGRPRKPELQKGLEAELRKLRRENQNLRQRLSRTDHLLEAVSDTMTGKLEKHREPATRKTRARTNDSDAQDGPSSEPAATLARDREMKALRIAAPIRAVILGVGSSTLRRWRADGALASMRARRRTALAPEREAEATTLIRRMNGRIGAVALSKAVSGLSRRAAARLVRSTRATLERERKSAAQQVIIASPGVVRGFDAMEMGRGRGHVLVSTDSAVPYRTSALYSVKYDAAAVRSALAEDFAKNGAPLVLRMDRAKQHRTPEVDALLAEHKVLVLHGPPRHPRYYGQLERQNREHREWLEAGRIGGDEVSSELPAMITALNAALPRRLLGWRTAESVWSERSPLQVDRDAFAAEVDAEQERITREQPELERLHVRRIAIERALINHGLLKLRRPEGAGCF